jgi:hypothetical protein
MKWGVRKDRSLFGNAEDRLKRKIKKHQTAVERAKLKKQVADLKREKVEIKRETKVTKEATKQVKNDLKKKTFKPANGASVDHQKAYNYKNTPIEHLTNDEIKILNERLDLVEKYYKLNPKKKSMGKKVWDKMAPKMGDMAANVAMNYAKQYLKDKGVPV